jgi:hypothetical protein
VKFRSSLIQIGPFTAANAGPRNDRQEDDIKILTLTVNYPSFILLFFPSISCLLLKSADAGCGRQNLNIKEPSKHSETGAGPVVQLV